MLRRAPLALPVVSSQSPITVLPWSPLIPKSPGTPSHPKLVAVRSDHPHLAPTSPSHSWPSTPTLPPAPLGCCVLTRMLLCLYPVLLTPAYSPLASQGLGPHLLAPPSHPPTPVGARDCLPPGPSSSLSPGEGGTKGPCHHCSTGQPDAWVLRAPSWRGWGAASLASLSYIAVHPGLETLGGVLISLNISDRNGRHCPQPPGNLGDDNDRYSSGHERQEALRY